MIKLKDILKEITIPNNMRIHMSKTTMTLQKKKYTQADVMKPNGFWYGFGKEWIDWTKTEMPEWVGKYIYEVKGNESPGHRFDGKTDQIEGIVG